MATKTPTFNLVDQPWIPCVWLDGRRELLGLEAVLVHAHELREIYDDSPLVTVSLHRLLLAIVHHALRGPARMSDWAKLWQNGKGRFDATLFTNYLRDQTRYRRFDLFDAERPFYQCSAVPFERPTAKNGVAESYTKTVAKLATELSANDTLFHHEIEDRPQAVTSAQAARLVLAAQSYLMGGRITFERKEDGSADASPLVKGAIVLVRGESLFQTLLLNLIQYDGPAHAPFVFDPSHDVPTWDRDEQPQSCDRKVAGYVDLLTWQSRRMRLQPETDAAGNLCVRNVVVMKGEQFLDGFHRHGYETMVAFTKNKDATDKQDPWPAVGFSEDRVVWRNSLALFESVEDVRTAPSTIAWLDELADEHLDRNRIVPLDLFGLSSDQAKVLLWRHERLPLPLKLLRNNRLLRTLEKALEAGEELRKVLWQTATEFARVLLMQTTDSKKQPGTEQRKDMQKIVDSLEIERRFWAALETEFVKFLGTELLKEDAAYDREFHATALAGWKATLNRVARAVVSEAITREDGSSRALKAHVAAERLFDRLLKKTLGSGNSEFRFGRPATLVSSSTSSGQM